MPQMGRNKLAPGLTGELSPAASDESSAIFCQHVRGCERRLSHYGRTYDWEDDPEQTVVDFISSMTDDYFMATCQAVFPDSAKLFPLRGYFGDGVRP